MRVPHLICIEVVEAREAYHPMHEEEGYSSLVVDLVEASRHLVLAESRRRVDFSGLDGSDKSSRQGLYASFPVG